VALRASLGYPAFVALGVALPAVMAGAWEGTWSAAGLGALWAGGVRICWVHHVTWSVNSVCHLWGRRPFATRDHSRNHAVVALLSLGEGWHNNHHAFPWSARHGLGRWQIDVSWWAIRGLAWAGLASQVRLPAVEVGR
jgi:stearoyl-CoA desaturase (delta-9 desaturase)